MKKIFLLFVLLVSMNLFSLEDYVGLNPKEIVDTLGAPDYILPQRGDKAMEDDVIFFYNDRFYLYFNQNRVWQMRVDEKYTGEVLNLKIGLTTKEVKVLLGEPLETRGNSFIYRRPDKGYPLILRIYFTDDKINDIYVYRGDY